MLFKHLITSTVSRWLSALSNIASILLTFEVNLSRSSEALKQHVSFKSFCSKVSIQRLVLVLPWMKIPWTADESMKLNIIMAVKCAAYLVEI